MRRKKLNTISLIAALFGYCSVAVAQEVVAESASVSKEQGDQDAEVKPPPLFGSYDAVWGRFALSYRVRPEFRANRDFNSDAEDKNFKIGQRARFGLGFNYQKMIQSFVQVQDTRAFGWKNTSVSNPSIDGAVDLHQGWVQINFANDVLALKVGRQQLVYGDQRLVGHLEWLDQGRVFDAALFKINYSIGQLDFFEAPFTPDNTGNLLSGSTNFFGVYNTMHFLDKTILFDLYVLGLVDADAARKPGRTFSDDPEPPGDGATPEEQSAYEEALAANEIDRHEVTVGTRLRYNHKIIKTGIEVTGQFGKANSNADIGRLAVALHADVKAVLPVVTKPFLGVEINYATGDKDATDDVNNQFNNLFPTNHLHYGFMDLAAWSNAINFAVRAGFAPSKHFILNVDYWLFAKASTEDGWYNATGVNTAGTTTEDEQLLGHELDLTLKFPIIKHLKVVAGAGIFIPAAELTTDASDPNAAYDGDVQTWAYGMMIVNY